MIGEIRIRPAQSGDIEKLSVIGLQAWNRSIGSLVPGQVRETMDNVISDLWVAHQYEGKGVGRALVQHIEIEIKKEGYPTSRINVATENARALGLYQHLGYGVIWQGSRFDPILQIDIHKTELEKRIL